MKIITVVQARLASTRLPRKVLAQLTPQHTSFSFLKDRIENANHDSIWLATSNRDEDVELIEIAQGWGWQTLRGSENDVLSRFVSICLIENPDWIIRVTADNPLTHKDGLNLLVEQAACAPNSIGYISDFIERQSPQGALPEIVRPQQLMHISKLELPSHHKVHVTSAIVESGFGVERIKLNEEFPSRPDWRWTVDEQIDLDFVRALCLSIGSDTIKKTYQELVQHIDSNLWLSAINKNGRVKSIQEG